MEWYHWLGAWWLVGIVIVIITTTLAAYFDEIDHLSLKDVGIGITFTLAGPLLLILVSIGLYTMWEERADKIIVWSSKSHKAKQVLGLEGKK